VQFNDRKPVTFVRQKFEIGLTSLVGASEALAKLA
jgi:hypothetical protein